MAGPSKHSGKLFGSRPSGSAEIRVLKSGAKRTVVLIGSPTRSLKRSRTDSLRVVKRFHSPGLGGHRALGAFGDLRRAAAEARALRRAQAAGLPVPTPGPVERSSDGGWELSMVAIPGARTLSEVLSTAFTGSTWSRQRLQQLAERTGALARQVEEAGFLHADPHPANVIVGQDDQLLRIAFLNNWLTYAVNIALSGWTASRHDQLFAHYRDAYRDFPPDTPGWQRFENDIAALESWIADNPNGIERECI